MSVELPYSYFLDEVRDGFLVPTMMKRVWAVCMDNLETLREEMEKNDGRVYACFGTLLGAVRAAGFVPWDDDIDVDVFRYEYDRLKAVSDRGELPGDYRIYDYVKHGDDNDVRKLHDQKTRIISSSAWPEHFGYPYDNNIDMFLLDFLPDDKEERETYENVLKILAYLKTKDRQRETEDFDEKEFFQLLDYVREVTGLDPDAYGDIPFVTKTMLMSDEIADRYTSGEEVIKAAYYLNHGTELVPRRFYDHIIEMSFENMMIPAPAGYDGILRQVWGNYMCPKFTSSGHEYPCFEGYEEDLKGLYDMELFKYHIDTKQLLDDMAHRPHKAPGDRWNISFLSYRASDWDSVHGLWEELSAREDVEVAVIAVPYFYRGYNASIISDDIQFETEGYPDEVVITPYDCFDIGEWHPDVIVTQYPYDEYCEAMDILPFFHSKNLIHYTDHLVLIPPFTLREITEVDERSRKMLRRYLRTPGFIYADQIYVQSENMKQVFTELLEEFIRKETGENSEDVLDLLKIREKIYGYGLPVSKNNSAEIPEDEKDEKKALLLQFTGSRIYCEGQPVLDKAAEVVDYLAGYRDRLDVLYLEDRYAESVLKENCPELWKAYREFICGLEEKGVTLYGAEEEAEAVRRAAGCYGDGSIAMNCCRLTGKPAMMENLGVSPEGADGYETKAWTDDLTVVYEGGWSLKNFVDELVDKSITGAVETQSESGTGVEETPAQQIIRSIESSLYAGERASDENETYQLSGEGRPPRLLLYEWNSYMRQDTQEALKKLGIPFDVYTYNDYRALKEENPEVDQAVSELLATGNYDAVFSLNYRTVIARCAHRAGVPYISWIYDCPFGISENEEVLRYPTNYIFTFDSRTCMKLIERGIAHAYHQPLAVNVDRLDRIGINPDDREKYGADVAFVGKLYPSKFDAFYQKLPPYEAGMVDCAIEVQSKVYGAYLLDVMTEGSMAEKIQTAIEGKCDGYDWIFHESLQSIICKEITRRERLMILYMLSQEHKTALYTNKSEAMLDKVLDRGVVDGYEEIYKVYKSAKINLNITFKRITEGIPLRALDIMGAGGFLLSNYQPELVQYFEPGVECIVYDSMEDAIAKANYYLTHEEERLAIAAAGREKARQFSYERQLKGILDVVFSAEA